MRNKIVNHMSYNMGLKLLALLVAVLLWLVIVNVADPVNTQTFRNVPVTMQHEEVVTDRGKTYQVVDAEQTTSVVVKAKRSVLTKMKAEDIVATADLRELELESLVPIAVSITGFEGNYLEANAAPKNLQVMIEDASSNKFPITAVSEGSLSSGYALGEMSVTPEAITISGPESLVSTIARVNAKVNVNGLTEDKTFSGHAVQIVLYDDRDREIDQSLLSSDNVGNISVDVEVLQTKEVKVEVNASGTPAEGYTVAELKYEPQRIEVCGREKVLEDLDIIRISGDAVDVTGADQKKEVVVDVTEYLPEGVSLVDEKANTIAVSVMIDRWGTKSVEYPVASIEVKNSQNALKVSYNSLTNLDLQFRGASDKLDALTIGKIKASIDLSAYTQPGDYQVPLSVEVPEGYTLEGIPIMQITLTK